MTRNYWQVAVAAAILMVVSALLQWAVFAWAVLPWGSQQFNYLSPILYVIWTGAWFGIPLSLYRLYAMRRSSVRVALKALLLCSAVAAGDVGGCVRGQRDRMRYTARAVAAAQPLTQALHSFERDAGRPARMLSELVPRYIAAVPGTGMGGYTNWRYLVGSDAYEGNSWVLCIRMTGPGISFDQVLYFPNQRYPASCCGGALERVGAWAYVHE